MKVLLKYIVIIITYIAFCANAIAYDDQRAKVKAVFLYKFFNYVTWQEQKDPATHPPAIICTIGSIQFNDALRYVSSKQQKTLSNKIVSISNTENAQQCHILFVAESELPALNINKITDTLTVSDAPEFAESLGVIELQDKADNITLRINLSNASKQNLKISSKLLKIAEVVK